MVDPWQVTIRESNTIRSVRPAVLEWLDHVLAAPLNSRSVLVEQGGRAAEIIVGGGEATSAGHRHGMRRIPWLRFQAPKILSMRQQEP